MCTKFQGEGIASGRWVSLASKLLRPLLRLGAMAQLFEAATDHLEIARRETCAAETVFEISGRADFTRRSAANDENAGKQTTHFFSENIQVVRAGTEENYQRNIRLYYRGVKLANGVACISCA